jgi:hypothetical protein
MTKNVVIALSLTFVLAASGSPAANEVPFTHQQLASIGVETSVVESAEPVTLFMAMATVKVPPIQKTRVTRVNAGKRLLKDEISREQVRLQRDQVR